MWASDFVGQQLRAVANPKAPVRWIERRHFYAVFAVFTPEEVLDCLARHGITAAMLADATKDLTDRYAS